MSDEDILMMNMLYPEYLHVFDFSKCVSIEIHPSSNDTYVPLFDNKVVIYQDAIFYLHKKWTGMRQSNYRSIPEQNINDALAVQLLENDLHRLVY